MKVALFFVVIAALYLLSYVKSEEQEAASNAEPPAKILNSTDSETEATAKEKRGAQDGEKKGACECAVFNTDAPEPGRKPLISRSPTEVPCDESGRKRCEEVCVVLVRAGREKAAQTLCEAVGHAVNLKPSVFSKVCNEVSYSFSGLTSNNTYCCHENEPVQCKDAEK